MVATRGPSRHGSTGTRRIKTSLAQQYGPHESEHREPKEAPSTGSADLTYVQMVQGFVEDPEFRAMVEDEARIAMFGGRGGRRPLPSPRRPE